MKMFLTALLAYVGALQEPLVTLTVDPTVVNVGETYVLSMRYNASEVHVVAVDNVPAASFLKPGDCVGTSPAICTYTWTKTATTPGKITHTLTSVFANGTARPAVVATITVTGTAPSQPVWTEFEVLTSSVYSGHRAQGTSVILCDGTGLIRCRVSADQGETFGPWQDLGPDTLYLEHPIAISGDTAGIAAVEATQAVRDFCCAREVGEITLRRMVGGVFQPRRVVTQGAKALRLSLAISGSTWHLTWMDYRRGAWDLYYRRSTNAGASWQPEVRIASGTNAVGAERPSLVASGDNVHLAWMDARDSKAACVIEGGTQLPVCTEIYTARSLDAGASWEPAVRRTSSNAYAGRPDVAVLGSTVLIGFDHRVAGGQNDIAWLRSTDNGATFSSPDVWTAPGEQTHAALTSGPAGFSTAWMDNASGSYGVKFRVSLDGLTWSSEEELATSGAGAPSISQSREFHHVSWAAPRFLYRRRGLAVNSTIPPTPMNLRILR